MQYSSPVLYVDSNGNEHDAMVTAVTGTGDSRFKRVTVVFDDQTRENVPHELDASKGGVYWKERPVEEAVPTGTAFAVVNELRDDSDESPVPPPLPGARKKS